MKTTTKIDLLKTIHNVKSTEVLFDITEQPDFQCSSIDKVISNILDLSKNIQSHAYDLKRASDLVETNSIAEDLDWDARNIDFHADLEKIRLECATLRDWGNEWKRLAKRLLNDREDMEEFLASEFYLTTQPNTNTK